MPLKGIDIARDKEPTKTALTLHDDDMIMLMNNEYTLVTILKDMIYRIY